MWRLNVPVMNLDNGLVIEDYVIYTDLLLDAMTITLEGAAIAENIPVPVDLMERIRSAWSAYDSSKKHTADWFKQISREFLNVEPSKVALARNYAFLCREQSERASTDAPRLKRALDISKRAISALALPRTKAARVIEQPITAEQSVSG